MIKPRLLATPALLILLLCSLQTAATSVLPVSLQRIATLADIAFHGKAVSNEVRLDPVSNRIATFTTFEVIEVIKGKVDRTHTIKQIGGHHPGSKARLVIHGVPEFTTGREYVVFLPKVSSLGFSSPLGLSQGKFDIGHTGGKAVIHNNRVLGSLMPAPQPQALSDIPSAIQAGPLQQTAGMPLTDFLQYIRGMVNE